MEDGSTISVTLQAEEVKNQKNWFCIQTHPKHEHLAANRLVALGGFEVFNPQMRIHRATKRGPVWFTESTFPGYIFVRFNLQLDLNAVRYSSSVSKVIHFNSGYPSIPESQMNELRAIFGTEEIVVLTQDVMVGDKIRIVGGAFHDLIAVVQQVRPAGHRIKALLEFLGRMTTVELDLLNVTVEERSHPQHHPLNREGVSVRSEVRAAR